MITTVGAYRYLSTRTRSSFRASMLALSTIRIRRDDVEGAVKGCHVEPATIDDWRRFNIRV
jgi:hypothetical protein